MATLPTFNSTQYLAGLNISSGTRDTLVGNGNGHRSMLYTTSLTDSGTLDLTSNDLDVQSGGPTALATVTALVAQGYNNGAWLGTGTTSSAAAADPSHLTALGVILNTASGITPIYTTLDGAAVAVNDVLVKYTYYGDCNLDGKVDGSDYSRIDAAYLADKTHPGTYTGWYNGDFNYDGVINGSDYTLIDNAFNTQGAQLNTEIAVTTTQIAGVNDLSSVPEPTTATLLVSTAIGLLTRRGRKNTKGLEEPR